MNITPLPVKSPHFSHLKDTLRLSQTDVVKLTTEYRGSTRIRTPEELRTLYPDITTARSMLVNVKKIDKKTAMRIIFYCYSLTPEEEREQIRAAFKPVNLEDYRQPQPITHKKHRQPARLYANIPLARRTRTGIEYLIGEQYKLQDGVLQGRGNLYYMELHRLLVTHLILLARSGFGKSFAISTFLESLSDVGIPTVVIAPTDEYTSMKHPSTKKEMGVWSQYYSPKAYADRILSISLNSLHTTYPGLFSVDAEGEASYNLVRLIRGKNKVYGGITIIHGLRHTGSEEESIAAIEDLLQRLYLAREAHNHTEEGIPPMLLVLEELHNYLPRGKTKKHANIKDIVHKVLTEGRKIQFGVIGATTHPDLIDTKALDMFGTQLFGNLPSRLLVDFDVPAKIRSHVANLGVGEFILRTPLQQEVNVVKIRAKRSSHEKGGTRDMLEEIQKWV